MDEEMEKAINYIKYYNKTYSWGNTKLWNALNLVFKSIESLNKAKEYCKRNDGIPNELVQILFER